MNNSSENSDYVHAPSTIFKLVVYSALAALFTLCFAMLAFSAFAENNIGGGVFTGLIAGGSLVVAWKLWHVRVPTSAEVAEKERERERLETQRQEFLKSTSGSSTDSDSAILFIFFWLPLICGFLYLLFTSAPWWAAVIILLLLVIVLS